jgi:hypothetical protein
MSIRQFVRESGKVVRMSGKFTSTPLPLEECPFGTALRAATAECLAARKCSQSDRALILALGARAAKEVRDNCYRALGDMLLAPTNRGGETFENVIELLGRVKQAEWTAIELRRSLARNGCDVSSKKLSDVTNYLVRTGRFKRIARGRYLDAAGNAFVTSEEFRQFELALGGENED